MLSRHAAHLYWMARYVERAETIARLLEVGARATLTPDGAGGFRNDWGAILDAMGLRASFEAKFRDLAQRDLETFLFFDAANPSSVLSCLEAARENARVVRTALTGQVWDALNTAYADAKDMRRTERSQLSLSDLTDWTLRTCATMRGAIEATQMRNDAYAFLHAGFALERLDNTARLLDVKYYLLLPDVSLVGSPLDRGQWALLLKSLSAHRAFGWAYGSDLRAETVAHFLILNRMFPRSLLASAQTACDALDALARGYGASGPAQTQARALLGHLAETDVAAVFDEGLHDFLTRVRAEGAQVGAAVAQDYLGAT
ncbi:MAG: alpha-E domain-containing protein [Paracoccaceae bacterium]